MINNSDEITQLTNQSDWDKQKIKSRDLNLYAVDIGSGCVFEFIKYEKHYKILDEGILEENFQINEELKYEKILPEFFPWKNHMKENLSVEQLPIKLYNIKTKKVEEVNDLSKVNLMPLFLTFEATEMKMVS